MKTSVSRFRRAIPSVIGLVLTMGAATAIWMDRDRMPRRELADGRWVAIRNVTRADTNGTHTVQLGARWRLALARYRLPDRLKDWIQRDTGTVGLGSQPDSLGIWWTAGAGGTNSAGYIVGRVPDDLQNSVWRVVAENGWVYPIETRGLTAGVDLIPLHRLILNAFPRRQEQMKVQMCNASNGGVIASFVIRNPYPVSTNVWTPEPWPSTRQLGPLTVHLDSIDSGVLDPSQPTPAFGMKRRFTPRVRLTAEGMADPGWQIASVQLLDASGNRGEFLDPSEQAWKVRVEIRPNALTRGPRDVAIPVAASSIGIPRPGEWQPMTTALTLDGWVYPIIGIGGPGRHVFTNGLHSASQEIPAGGFESSSTRIGTNSTVSFGRPQPVLCGRDWPSPPAGARIVLRARTPDGRESAVNEEHRTGSFSFIPIPADLTGEVHLELVLQKTEIVEFLVLPPRLSAR